MDLFHLFQVSIEEFTPKDVSVVRVNATDADFGRNAEITYSLTVAPSTGFYIDSITGRNTTLLHCYTPTKQMFSKAY